MLQGNLADDLMAGVHRASDAVLARLQVGGLEQEVGCRRCPQVKGKRAIGTNGNTGGNRDAGVDVGGSGIELLSGC